MKLAETVTFGGSGLDRADDLRADAEAVCAAYADPAARVILFWQGKPLVEQGALMRLPTDHPVLADRTAPPILLAREDGAPRFACDISSWVPDGQDTGTLGAFVDTSLQQHPGLPEGQVFAELRRLMAEFSPRDAELAATAKAVLGWHVTHRFCARCGAESRMALAGWQRICPDCGGHHFPRTDPVVIMLITHGNSVLMGRSHGWPDGMYSLLAGFVEPGETIEGAVRREVWEEAGVRVGRVTYLASQPWPFPSSLMLGCAGEALSHEIDIDPKEIEDAMWVTREEMMAAYGGGHSFLKPARRGAIAQFLIRNWLADRLD